LSLGFLLDASLGGGAILHVVSAVRDLSDPKPDPGAEVGLSCPRLHSEESVLVAEVEGNGQQLLVSLRLERRSTEGV
jgi:hypothetical protein